MKVCCLGVIKDAEKNQGLFFNFSVHVTSNTSGATVHESKALPACGVRRGSQSHRVTSVITPALAFLLFLHSLGNNGRHVSSAHPLCLLLTPTKGSRVSVCPYHTVVSWEKKNNLSNSIKSILYRASQHPLPVPRSSSNFVDFILILHHCCAIVLGLL